VFQFNEGHLAYIFVFAFIYMYRYFKLGCLVIEYIPYKS